MTEPTKEALWIALCEKDDRDPKVGRAMVYKDEFFAALEAFAAQRVAAARLEVIEFCENGRFLHDDAPPRRWAMEFAEAARKKFALKEPNR